MNDWSMAATTPVTIAVRWISGVVGKTNGELARIAMVTTALALLM